MNNKKMKLGNEEESINTKLIKKIKYLEYINSSLKQTNQLLSNKLYSITKKYNDLKNELYDTECHINFCKKNLLDLIDFKKEQKEKKDKNFMIFKNKIKTLFEYGDDFMKTNSETVVFNMIIDNIKNILEENTSLRKNLFELKKVIYQKEENNINNYISSPINYNKFNNSEISQENNEYENESNNIDNDYDDIDDFKNHHPMTSLLIKL